MHKVSLLYSSELTTKQMETNKNTFVGNTTPHITVIFAKIVARLTLKPVSSLMKLHKPKLMKMKTAALCYFNTATQPYCLVTQCRSMLNQ